MNAREYKDLLKKQRKAFIEDGRKNDIATVTCIFNDLFTNHIDGFKTNQYLSELKSEYNRLSYREYIQSLYKLDVIDNIPLDTKYGLKEDDVIAYIHDVFKNATCKKAYEDYLKAYHQCKDNIIFLDNYYKLARCFCYLLQNNPWIVISRTYNFNEVTNLAHEFGHIIRFNNSYSSRLVTNIYYLDEIMSTFFELVACEYYSNQRQGLHNQIECFNSILRTAQCLELDYTLLESNTKIITKRIHKYNSNDLCYIISSTIAFNLFMIYLQDRDKAFYLLYQAINKDTFISLENYYKYLANLGLTDLNGNQEYHDYLKRKLIQY